MNRREFLQATAKMAALAAIGAAAYGGSYGRSHLVVRRVDVPLARLPEAFDGFTIAQLSDLHYHPEFSAGVIRSAVELVAQLKPDLVALTGDFVTVPHFRGSDALAARDAIPCSELLAPLQAPLGVFAVLGNHDSHTDPEVVVDALSSHKVQVLQNDAVPLERDGTRIWIAGVNDVLAGQADLHGALQRVPPSEAVLLLAHEPDFADEVARHPVDFQMSGHSHGGQVRLPLLPPLFLPPLGRKYPTGLRKIRSTLLYTNVGIGTIIVPIRLLAAPEVTLFTLRHGPQTGV